MINYAWLGHGLTSIVREHFLIGTICIRQFVWQNTHIIFCWTKVFLYKMVSLDKVCQGERSWYNGEREWLVLGQSGVLECEERDCHPEQVLIDGLCLDIDHSSNCTGSGNTTCMLLDKHDLLQYSSTLINIPTWAYKISYNLCNAT